MRKQANWDTVGFLLQEAVEQLELYVAEIQFARTGEVPKGFKGMVGPTPMSEDWLRLTLVETYRRLNFAWNNRYSEPRETDVDSGKKNRFPAVFTRQWNRERKEI